MRESMTQHHRYVFLTWWTVPSTIRYNPYSEHLTTASVFIAVLRPDSCSNTRTKASKASIVADLVATGCHVVSGHEASHPLAVDITGQVSTGQLGEKDVGGQNLHWDP